MSKSVDLRKRELECLRLESDCRQLADAVHSPTLKSHFIEMAKTGPSWRRGDLSTSTTARL